MVYAYARKHHELLNSDLSELEHFSKSKKNTVLKALIALSKYLGVYVQFKNRIKAYGIIWERQNSVESFLRIINAKNDLKEWLEKAMKTLNEDQKTFMEYACISGLRKSEAVNSFNLVIKLSKEGKLNEYYNSELQSLEHFRFKSLFLRNTKNAFISFIPKEFIQKIACSKPISYGMLRITFKKHGLSTRIKDLRNHHATFMLQHGLLKEEVDLLHGRIGDSIFMKSYFSPKIGVLRDRTLKNVHKLKGMLPIKTDGE